MLLTASSMGYILNSISSLSFVADLFIGWGIRNDEELLIMEQGHLQNGLLFTLLQPIIHGV